MITLSQHQEEIKKFYAKKKEGRTGVACDLCGSELFNSDPGMMLMSNPPKIRVECRNPDCQFDGYMTV
jgi:hypothetical protein